MRLTNDSWRVDETYIKVKGKWKYLYRAVDSEGNTIIFYFVPTLVEKQRSASFAKLYAPLIRRFHESIMVNNNAAYSPAIAKLQAEKALPNTIRIRQIKYLNNIVEQDHRFIKKLIRPMLKFQFFQTATRTLKGIEGLHMIKKRQIQSLSTSVPDKVIQNSLNW
ncbi:IS6 family transposase [Seinonella peptonophila]|uniref:IS6 family transposase n=1 Tax=Seinonella peptonophila TaxID=112248 RepID=UPI0009FD71E8